MSEPLWVNCCRCLEDWAENDPGVQPKWGDWWCTDEAACNDRLAALLDGVNGL